jgi:hypothetical protein
MKYSKSQLETQLKQSIKDRRIIKRETKTARKQLENLEDEGEDINEQIIDLRRCIKHGQHV